MARDFGSGIGLTPADAVIAGSTFVLDPVTLTVGASGVVLTDAATAEFVITSAAGVQPIISLSIGDGIEVTDYDPATLRITIAATRWPIRAAGRYLAQLTVTTVAGIVYREQARFVVTPAL